MHDDLSLSSLTSDDDASPPTLPPLSPALPPSLPDFDRAFGEPFARTLDLATWRTPEDLIAAYGRLEAEVSEALEVESAQTRSIRENLFPKIPVGPSAPPCAGVYAASSGALEQVHRGLLFNGGVEAGNGLSVVHDTIPLSITQIGVCLVSYDGRQGTWAHRLYRRDLRARPEEMEEEMWALLERRRKRSEERDTLSELARRGIMAYAERALLRDRSQASWRMGHGSPIPFELLSGLWASSQRNLRIGLDLIEWYAQHERFVFVPAASRKRHFEMIGNALRPREYAILQTLEPEIDNLINRGHYRDEGGVRPTMEQFCHEVAPKFVVGIFRVWEASPPHLFYAHVDHAHMAAHIAMADAMLQEHKGFPMLIDLAASVCRATFGLDSLIPSVQGSYAGVRFGRSDEALRYLNEQ